MYLYIRKYTIYIILLSLMLLSNISSSFARPYTHNQYSTPITTLSTYPVTTSEFYYQNTFSGSMSIKTIHYQPIFILNTSPHTRWITIKNNIIPDNAVVAIYLNGQAIYYCRIHYQNRYYFGQLSPQQGCIIFKMPYSKFNQYEILVKNSL